jgi:tetratricopeptide (TPR) repeat protein
MFNLKNHHYQFTVICLFLSLVTLGVYWPMMNNGFINFDDEQYVIANPHIVSGLTSSNILWAFKSGEAANWHPLTWISHMTDCDLFGLNPSGHHFVNLLFHIANTLLLFVWLRNLTNANWRSVFVAALFAWHPLHVESVAWASERKDTLSTFFWMLTLLAWTGFVKKRSLAKYFLALFFFACGLMSKPMVVTLPCVLLLLDFWPLNRVSLTGEKIFSRITFLIVEKTPFFILAAAGSAVTFLVQKTAGAMWASSWDSRVENVLLAYVRYASKLFWPHDLAIVYSYQQYWPIWLVVGAALILMIWTTLFIFRARQNPYLIVGWLWFIGTLVPAIGIVQVGAQSLADRYTYIPGIGLFILVAWGANELLDRWPDKKKFLPVVAGVALIALLGVTSIQINYWHDSTKLFLHAVEVTENNYVAENCLGKAFEKSGDNARALVCYMDAVKIEPRYPQAQFNLAICLFGFGKNSEGLEHLRAAAKLEPHNSDIQYDLGTFFLLHGSPLDAARGFRAALENRPNFPRAQRELDKLLAAHPELTNSSALDIGK